MTACQDLYTHPPGKHEGVLVNTYRVPLDRFGDERPKLTFIPADEDDWPWPTSATTSSAPARP